MYSTRSWKTRPVLAYLTSVATAKHIPIQGGVACYNAATKTATGAEVGTIGCVVMKNGKAHLLSNQHAFFPNVNGVRAPIGSLIYQVGDPTTPVAKTTLTIAENNPWPTADKDKGLQQIGAYHDSAIAEVLVPWTTEIVGIGSPTGVAEAKVGMKVKISGATSGIQKGTVTQVGVNEFVDGGPGKVSIRKNLFKMNIIGGPGDSGSAILSDPDNKLIGLFFSSVEGVAGSQTGCRIQPIIERYGLTIPTKDTPETPEPEEPEDPVIISAPGTDISNLINSILAPKITIGGVSVPIWMVGLGGIFVIGTIGMGAAIASK